jgi:amino acid permease
MATSEYEALHDAESEPAHRFSITEASFALAKCIVGAGCFVLPAAVKSAGLWLGSGCMLLLGVFTWYTISLLAYCAQEHTHRVRQHMSADDWFRHQLKQQNQRQLQQPTARVDVGVEDLHSVEAVDFVTMGRDLIHPFVRHVIRIGILATILGVCAIYLDLIGHLLADVLGDRYAPFTWWAWSQRHVQWTLLPLILFLALLKSLRYLAFTSILGDIAVAACALFVIIYGAQNYSLNPSLPAADIQHFPSFFASTVFLFAVHVVALPISQKMQSPEEFSRASGISFAVLTSLNALFAAFAYMLYGPDTKTLILDNITGSSLGDAVKVLLCVDLIFTLPIIMTAPRELMESLLLPHAEHPKLAAADEHLALKKVVLHFILKNA